MNRIPQSNGGGNKKTSPKATDNSRYAGSFVKRNRRRIIVGREDKSALNTMSRYNVIRHMNEFRNILSYASNIGFFFGAGTSCAFGLPNIVQLTNRVKTSLAADQLTLFESVESSIMDLNGKTLVTVEDVLNYLREIRELTRNRGDYDFKGLSGKQAAKLDQEICLVKLFD